MTKLKNKTKYLIASLLLLGFITYSSSVVMADEQDDYPPFVQTLAEKLNVDEKDVEDAFDEIRAEHFAERQNAYEDQLNNAVEAGVLTEDQKNALLDKHEEMIFQQGQKSTQHREEMQTWFEEQGINQEDLQPFLSGPHGLHHKGMGLMH